jgi:hypothetical protein
MASWLQLKQYIHSTYKVSEDIGDGIKLLFETTDGRSQLVFLTRQILLDGAEDWVLIESPFGELGRVDLAAAVTEVGNLVCGGIAASGKFVTLRHAVRLPDLDLAEFERPLVLVTVWADRLEAAFTGGDGM